MRDYAIKEIFKTLQGEGYWTGRPAIFVRFAGCNLWSGREEDRATAACRFCDTDFLGGERMTSSQITERCASLWGEGRHRRFVILTGGEPTLQVDYPLVQAFERFGFETSIETNGTRAVACRMDWITISPKADCEVVQQFGDELKLVYPQDGIDPEQYTQAFGHYFLQPMDGPNREENTRAAIDYCLSHPKWRLSVQTHKFIGLP